MRSTTDSAKGKLAHTAYTVIKETESFSLLKIDLLTGRKNQIRVHLADQGHPVVGDDKYGKAIPRANVWRCMHSHSLLPTLFSGKRLTFTAPVPEYFTKLIGPWAPSAPATKEKL